MTDRWTSSSSREDSYPKRRRRHECHPHSLCFSSSSCCRTPKHKEIQSNGEGEEEKPGLAAVEMFAGWGRPKDERSLWRRHPRIGPGRTKTDSGFSSDEKEENKEKKKKKERKGKETAALFFLRAATLEKCRSSREPKTLRWSQPPPGRRRISMSTPVLTTSAVFSVLVQRENAFLPSLGSRRRGFS